MARSPLAAPALRLTYNTTAPLIKVALLVLHACVEAECEGGSCAQLEVETVEVWSLEVDVEVTLVAGPLEDVSAAAAVAAQATGGGAVAGVCVGSAAAGAADGVAAAAGTRKKGTEGASCAVSSAAGEAAEPIFTPP